MKYAIARVGLMAGSITIAVYVIVACVRIWSAL